MIRAFFALALLALGVGGFMLWKLNESFDAPGASTTETRVLIERGANPASVARMLEAEGLLEDGMSFRLLTRLTEKGGKIRAGEFLVPPGASPRELLTLFTEGPTVVRKFTVPEGATTAEALAIVAGADGLVGAVPADVPEGALLPETYHYAWNDTREDAVARMRAAMAKTVANAMATRPEGHPVKTADDLITLASIVEKETGLAEERPRVAAVFVNRLNRKMLLQSDPTTIYAITRGAERLGRKLTYADLRRDDPYNTYVSPGLPPGPIANPGKAALFAAANPPETDDLYFVADGTGGHAFAKTLAGHNRNVRKWRHIQRERGER